MVGLRDACRFGCRCEGMRLYTFAPLAVNSHAADTVVAGQSARGASYRLPLDNAGSIIAGDNAVIDGVGNTGNGIAIIMAGAGFIPAKGMFFCVEWLSVWDNRNEVVAVVLHIS